MGLDTVVVNWRAVLPHLILAVVGCLVLVVSAGRKGRAGNLTLWVSAAATLAAMVAAWTLPLGPPAEVSLRPV